MTIKESPIDGLGLFCNKVIKDTETSLGITHVFVQSDKFIYRTPLGGFINHSDEPNCELIRMDSSPDLGVNHLFPLRTIKKGEEITLKYTMYKVNG
jgi:SET domain-containing protein